MFLLCTKPGAIFQGHKGEMTEVEGNFSNFFVTQIHYSYLHNKGLQSCFDKRYLGQSRQVSHLALQVQYLNMYMVLRWHLGNFTVEVILSVLILLIFAHNSVKILKNILKYLFYLCGYMFVWVHTHTCGGQRSILSVSPYPPTGCLFPFYLKNSSIFYLFILCVCVCGGLHECCSTSVDVKGQLQTSFVSFLHADLRTELNLSGLTEDALTQCISSHAPDKVPSRSLRSSCLHISSYMFTSTSHCTQLFHGCWESEVISSTCMLSTLLSHLLRFRGRTSFKKKAIQSS